MRKLVRLLGLFTLLAGGPVLAEDPRLAASRDAVAEFGQALKAALGEGLSRGGPAAAIDVCAEQAPAIARDHSARLAARVGRTGVRVRNPDNKPSPAAARVMAEFADRIEQGAAADSLEHWRVADDGSALYMRPIMTGGVCLACHGATLDPSVREAIETLYPRDKATGFSEGELRGAFIVAWPAR